MMNIILEIAFFTFYFATITLCNSTPLKPVISQDVIQTATTPILDGYVYVDKSRFILALLRENPKRFFFARPRRFGKTIFLRILQAVFDDHRDGKVILQGTDIAKDPNYKWEKFPVLYFDLSAPSLEQGFNEGLTDFKQTEGIKDIPKECKFMPDLEKRPPPTGIQELEEILCVMEEKNSIILLVDEYDHHILDDLNNPVAYNYTVHFLKTFFTTVKRKASQFKLAFVTGITRSSFMLFNSPGGDFTDISSNPEYSEIAGFTKSELKEYFQGYIEKIATKRKVSVDKIEKELEEWYDGYTFTVGMESLYNPMSIVRYFQDFIPKIYWADEGRASFVWNQMKKRSSHFLGIKDGMQSNLRRMPSINHADPETLLFEAGYLTIKKALYDNLFIIGFPNKEVKTAFLQDQVNAAKFAEVNSSEPEINDMREAIHQAIPDLNTFLVAADTAIMKLPHPYDDEKGYQMNLYYLMRDCNVQVHLEYPVRGKEIDIMGETSNTILHFEMKLKSEGLKRTWNHTLKGIRHFFQKRKNVLSAALLFRGTQEKDTVLGGWYGELYSPEGNVLETYDPKNSIWFKKFSLMPRPRTKMSQVTTPYKPSQVIENTTGAIY